MRRLVAPLVAMMVVACSSTTSTSSANSIHAVPWLPLPRGNSYEMLPSPSAPVPVPPGTPVCPAAQLEGALASVGPAATPNRSIVLRNKASTPCYLNGVPDLTIVDGQGSVLGHVSGPGGTGTQFDRGILAVDVLMEFGTPPLVPANGVPADQLPPGEAFLNIKWTGCAKGLASKLWVDLPNGGGRVVVDFPVNAPGAAICTNEDPLIRDPLKPTAVAWPPAPDYFNLEDTLNSPGSVKHGSTLVFYVTIQNNDRRDFALSPCPDYSEALENGPVSYYQLNCGPVGMIRAGNSATFEMKFQIPASTAPGQWTLLWALVSGLPKPGGVQQPLTVT